MITVSSIAVTAVQQLCNLKKNQIFQFFIYFTQNTSQIPFCDFLTCLKNCSVYAYQYNLILFYCSIFDHASVFLRAYRITTLVHDFFKRVSTTKSHGNLFRLS